MDQTTLPPWGEQGGLRCRAFATHRALEIFLERQEQGAAYTVFSDPQAAIARALSDRSGPGQTLAKATIEPERLLREGGCSVTIRWAPTHKDIEETK